MIAALTSGWGSYLPTLLHGLVKAIKLSIAAGIVGLPLGLLLAVARMSASLPIRWIGNLVVELGRALPTLVVLQVAFYGLPSVGIVLSSFIASTAALGWITAAFSSEIFRGSIASIPTGQLEAASALALKRGAIFREIVLPQAVRVALPALLGLGIQIFQGTALAFTVGYTEVMSNAYDLGSQTFRYLSIFVLAGLLYTAVVIPASFFVRRVELRLGKHVASELR